MTEKEIEVIARGYDKYNGCYSEYQTQRMCS